MKQRMTIAPSAIAIVFAVVAVPLVGPLSTRAQEAVSEEEEESITPSVDNERSRKMNEKLRKVTEKVSEKAVLHSEDELQPTEAAASTAGLPFAEPQLYAKPRPAAGAARATIADPSQATPSMEQIKKLRRRFYEMGDNAAARSMAQIHAAAESLRDAETDEDKAKATQQLTDGLEQYFDEDMRRREAELTKIEERVRKLREQLDLRREKKREVINLQVQVAVNEAEGLGFFSQPAEGGGRGILYPPASSPFVPPTRSTDDAFRGR